MFNKYVLQRNSNPSATEQRAVRKLGMMANNVCTGPQDKKQVFTTLKFELNGPFDEFVQTVKLIPIYFQVGNRI